MSNTEQSFRKLYDLLSRANLSENDRRDVGTALDLLEELDIQFKSKLLNISGVYNNPSLVTIQHGHSVYIEEMQNSIEKVIRRKHKAKTEK